MTDRLSQPATASVVRDYFTVFFGHGVSAFLSFLASIAIARIVSISDFGIYSTFISLSTILATLMDFGVTSSLVRFGSSLTGRNDETKLFKMIRGAIAGKVLLGVIIGAVGLATIILMPIGNGLDGSIILILVPLAGISLSFFYLIQGVLQIRRRFKRVTMLITLKATLYILGILATVLLGLADPIVLGILFVITTIAATAVFSGVIRATGSAPKERFLMRIREARHLVKFGKWLAISGMCFTIFEQLPITIATAGFGTSDAAQFAVAVSLIGVLGLVNFPLQTIIIPDLSSLKSRSELKVYLERTYVFVLPFAALMATALFLLSDKAIVLLYGDAYASSAGVFMILVIPAILSFVTLPINSSLTFTFGRPHIAAVANTMQLVGLLILFALLTSVENVQILAVVYAGLKVGGILIVTILALLSLRRNELTNDPIAQ
jgi:O-antigen/teichoic acid export membrane protein